MREKKEKGQIFLFYNATRKNSLTVQLQLFAINGHDYPMISTAEMKRPFENLKPTAVIWDAEVSHTSGGKHVVTHTNCTVTVKMCLPKRDTWPMNTKQYLLKIFAKKLKRHACVNHS